MSNAFAFLASGCRSPVLYATTNRCLVRRSLPDGSRHSGPKAVQAGFLSHLLHQDSVIGRPRQAATIRCLSEGWSDMPGHANFMDAPSPQFANVPEALQSLAGSAMPAKRPVDVLRGQPTHQLRIGEVGLPHLVRRRSTSFPELVCSLTTT